MVFFFDGEGDEVVDLLAEEFPVWEAFGHEGLESCAVVMDTEVG